MGGKKVSKPAVPKDPPALCWNPTPFCRTLFKRMILSGFSGSREAEKSTAQTAEWSEPHTFQVIPDCCAVERSLVWLDQCRRLWKNCERKLNTCLQFIHLAFLVLLLLERL
jgi:transposase